jgi:hypothetical protein
MATASQFFGGLNRTRKSFDHLEKKVKFFLRKKAKHFGNERIRLLSDFLQLFPVDLIIVAVRFFDSSIFLSSVLDYSDLDVRTAFTRGYGRNHSKISRVKKLQNE